MSTPNRYLTVVLELPDSLSAKQAVLDALPPFGEFKGARITAMYAGDAITENERLERFVDAREVRLIREEANPSARMTLEA